VSGVGDMAHFLKFEPMEERKNGRIQSRIKLL
jgi:hypothetical protein